jgi:hypothetical protein
MQASRIAANSIPTRLGRWALLNQSIDCYYRNYRLPPKSPKSGGL